ncbi:MAG TPA: Gfo/Idh/MocA family oxidoreductase [Tepidisphaeraceae bacterium]|jgi:predicted dehydrogenase|nr:Gfo/Idh/MocA family oxidoreductase [Tepidisphaeraceae bacterium]
MDTLRVGIIGFGRIGADHATWIAAAKGIAPAAVADATPARQALAQGRGLIAYSTPAELLADDSIDAVLVSTPTAMHFEHASLALAAGKHVMVEKPMALDLAQARALCEEAERRGRVLSVFHNRRWDADYLTVKDAVASGALGKLINVESRLGQFISCVGPAAKEYRPNWRNEATFGGGGLYDWGSHFLDQLWRLLLPARPLRVFAQLRGNVWSTDCDDFARILIDFDNGVAALIDINTTTTSPLSRWRLDGTKGSASSPHSPSYDSAVWADLRFVPAYADPYTFPRAAPGLNETQIWERFALAIKGDGPPAVGARSVLMTMALLDAARESSRTGRAVEITEPLPEE